MVKVKLSWYKDKPKTWYMNYKAGRFENTLQFTDYQGHKTIQLKQCRDDMKNTSLWTSKVVYSKLAYIPVPQISLLK